MRYVLGLLCMLVPLLAEAQSATINLGWDYAFTTQDGFSLERKTGTSGTYAILPLVIPPAARTATDSTAPLGQIVCYRVSATLTTFRSPPSNEVCVAVLSAPLNLRIQ